MKPREKYFIGIDLGQLQDYTAVCAVRQAMKEDLEPVHLGGHVVSYRPAWAFSEYQLQYLQRLPLGTPYRKVAAHVKRLREALVRQGANVYTAADATGVGRPVIEMLKEEGIGKVYSVTITGGNSVVRLSSYDYHVPKRDLVSTLQVLLQNRTLRFAKDLPEAEALKLELQNFKVSLQTGHDSYEAWRESDHDDLVLSLALACWFAENARVEDWSSVRPVHQRF